MQPPLNRPPRILLTSVFGPYGVDDAYGREESRMELFHNQVTKAQGIASLRFTHRSFGLYFLAENVDADVTVLDFPSRRRFVQELRRGYDVVGISFITPNFRKAQEMARLTRRHAPGATILLGGHGAAIEGVAQQIDSDHVVKGEGIRWMRDFLGQDPAAPIRHPILWSNERHCVYGISIPGTTAALLVPGVGCVNGCNFCSTSHFFGLNYTPFLSSGDDLFREACRISDALQTSTFFVMDENFLKDRGRAMDFLDRMERNDRWFSFHLFSSAEAVIAFGVENLVRLGVHLLWIGAESTTGSTYAKNQGIDLRQLVQALRDHGISVLASGILGMEHHTPVSMEEDIAFLVGLEPDMVQFMLYTGLPGTALYEEHKRRGLLRWDLPFEEWHGQKHLNYQHRAFGDGESELWLRRAFRRDYEVNSSSMYRLAETAFRGYRTLDSMPQRDGTLEVRRQQLSARVREYSDILPTVIRHAVNETEQKRAVALLRAIEDALGVPSWKRRGLRLAARLLSERWALRLRLFGDRIQPRTIVTRYPAGRRPGTKHPAGAIDALDSAA